jgi:hypothetical protein
VGGGLSEISICLHWLALSKKVMVFMIVHSVFALMRHELVIARSLRATIFSCPDPRHSGINQEARCDLRGWSGEEKRATSQKLTAYM